ncbi:hypothetical protein J6TS7_29670 [Paenibacillus dendritiformis]|uniref:hypothetical protein n=1 Tax=Paenibacillus TaxID=44249 RepID=UPI001B2B419D|nr:hypothetical protein [Paenibacillus dendritiformis]GIO79357.1 hypothetical protein J6TS7_29670 [Paenibacillus dendritiformis]
MNKSNFSAMAQRLNELFGPKTFFPHRKHSKELTMRVRDIDFLRAEVFLDDLAEVSGDSASLTIPLLICLLYEDFLHGVRDTFNVDKMLQVLNAKRAQYFRKVGMPENLKFRDRWVTYPLVMKRSLALRGEVFLHDLAMHSDSFEMTLDELLSVLFMDFMVEVRSGKQREQMKLILMRLEDWN